jgi:hypothetical protein
MIVKTFKSPSELQTYLVAANITPAQVVALYFDGASGQHVLVHG